MHPNKLLKVYMAILEESAWWEGDPEIPDDPTIGYPYEWKVRLSVEAQTHGDTTTLNYMSYNGLDIVAGDYILTANGGRYVRVKEIESQTETEVVGIVEDVSRYNSRSADDSYGTGVGINEGGGILFSIVNSYPAIFGLPSTMPDSLSFFSLNEANARYKSIENPSSGGAELPEILDLGIIS